ncbi:MAG: hypothetical protein WAR37_03380 [Candidatus Microsaccharimonas sp.]
MKKEYHDALTLRIIGISLSAIALIFVSIKTFVGVPSLWLIYAPLIAGAIFTMIGHLVTIKYAPKKDLGSSEKREEALYDVIAIAIVMVLFIAIYVLPYSIRG